MIVRYVYYYIMYVYYTHIIIYNLLYMLIYKLCNIYGVPLTYTLIKIQLLNHV